MESIWMIKFYAFLLYFVVLLGNTHSLEVSERDQFKVPDPDYIEPNSKAKPFVNITDEPSTSTLLIEFTNIPPHYTAAWYGTSLHNIKESKTQIRVKKQPSHGHEPIYCLPFGIIGVTIQGVAIYNPYAKREGCEYAAKDQLDACRGTTDEFGRYHYYDYSPCVKSFKCNDSSANNLYGVAIDGYPIYGPYIEGGIEVTSVDLDDCGGRKDRMGRYRYHVVADRQNIISCLKGTIHKNSNLDFKKFVCDCPYQDAHFTQPDLEFCNETYLKKEDDKQRKVRSSPVVSTDSVTKNGSRNEELRIQECIPQTNFEGKHIEYSWWGGKPIRSHTVCRNTTGFCFVNKTLYENNVHWKQGDVREVDLMTCCGDECERGRKTCWVKLEGNSTSHVNPECVTPRDKVAELTMVVTPNTAAPPPSLGGRLLQALVIITLLSWQRPG